MHDFTVASIVNVESACSSASEIEPFGVLSDRRSVCRIFARPAISAVLNPPPPLDARLPPRTAGAPRLRRQSQLRESFVASDLEGGERDPRSPVSPARPVASSPSPSPAPDAAIDTVARPLPASASAGSCTHSAGRRSLKSSKSAEGLGMGLPSDLASLPPRQREVTSSGLDTASLMSTAEECLDLSRLASSPTSSAGSPNVMVSEERRGTRVFFKIPRFARRTLYAIPEVASPLSSSAAASPRSAASHMGRSLSAAWSDLASRLRSPGKSSGTPRFPATPLTSAPLAGPSGDAPAATVAAPTPLSSASPLDTSCLPQPPRLVPRQPRTPWLARLSRGSLSQAPTQTDGPRSPGMTEHLDAPRNGVPKRAKAGRLVRKLQMLF